jgi:uncharacterized protein (TIGR02270 family)
VNDMQPMPHRIHFGFRPGEISALPNPPVILEHASEAAFLWSQQRHALRAPHYRLSHLRALHERLQAHLEGLQVAGQYGWRAALDGLAEAEPGTVFTASWLAFCTAHREGMGHIAALVTADDGFADACISALSWLQPSALDWSLSRLAQSTVAIHRRMAVTVRSAHRTHTSESLLAALHDEHASVRAEACIAAGAQQLAHCDDLLQAASRQEDDAHCQYAACKALAMRGHCESAVRAWEIGQHLPAKRREALELAMRLGSPDVCRAMIRSLAATPGLEREATLAAGAFGDPATVPWLMGRCEDPALAPLAGEAISMITGLDLDQEGLSTEPPPTDAERQAEDEHLPFPDCVQLTTWWQQHGPAFAAGQRHLVGAPIEAGHAMQVLRKGYQRQRAAAALELSRLARGRPMFDVARRADLQLVELHA